MLLVVSYAMSKFKLCLGIDQKTYVKCVSNTGNDLAFVQNFRKNKISSRPDLYIYMFVSGSKKRYFCRKFWVRNKWMIPYVFRTL